jgi:hypothetical protein
MNLISTVETIYGAINRIDKNLAQNIYKLITVQMINFLACVLGAGQVNNNQYCFLPKKKTSTSVWG